MSNNKQSTNQHQNITELSRRLQRLSIEQKAISDEIERIVNTEGYNNNTVTRKQNTKKPAPSDRSGVALEVGQNVKLLTIGKFISTRGKITKIGKAKVTVQLDKTGKSTTRNFNNVLVL
jgi:transcription antitermination factor NusG